MAFRPIWLLLLAVITSGCSQALYDRRTMPVPRYFPPDTTTYAEGTSGRVTQPVTRVPAPMPPEPYAESRIETPSTVIVTSSPSAPANERVLYLRRGQGITQALSAAGCDPMMLADAIARSNIRLSELNRLPPGREIRVAEPCTAAPPVTARLSQLILDAFRLGRRTDARLQRQLAELRSRLERAEAEVAVAEEAQQAAENAKLSAEQALATLESKVRGIVPKPSADESLAVLAAMATRLRQLAQNADVEGALAAIELRATQTVRRWPWLVVGILLGILGGAALVHYRNRRRPVARDVLLGDLNYRETDDVFLIRKHPKGYEAEYVYSHHGIDPAHPEHPQVVYYKHHACGAENIKGERRNLAEHLAHCPNRTERTIIEHRPAPANL